MIGSKDFIDGDSHGQIVAVLFDRTVRMGKEAEYKQWYKKLIRLSEASPGHISTQVIQQGRRYMTVQQFASNAELESWLESHERQDQLAKLSALTENAPEPQALSGLEPWFELPGQAAPHVARWKMALMTFCVIYVLVTLLSYTLLPYIIDWPVMVRSLAFPVIMVPLMTYLIMPNLTRVLKRWLYR